MALEKTIKSQFGFDLTYWRISQSIADYDQNRTVVYLEGYPSKEVRQSDPKPSPVQTFVFGVEGTDLTRQNVYQYLQANVITDLNGNTLDFNDATDV